MLERISVLALDLIDGSGLVWALLCVFEAIVNLVNHVNFVLLNDGVLLVSLEDMECEYEDEEEERFQC